MKQNREKILLYAFLGVLAVWQGNSLFQWLFVDPVASRQSVVDGLEQEKLRKETDSQKLRRATLDLKRAADRSLPPDPVIAQMQYQPWLLELATQARLTEPTIKIRSDLRPKEGTYYTIYATLEARGTLDRVCDFLHAFHQAGLLHRVAGMQLEADKHDGNPVLDIDINIEALALLSSKPRSTLFVDPKNPPKPERPLKDRKEYESIVAKNLFVKTYKGPKPPDRGPLQRPEQLPDTAEYVKLTATFSNDTMIDAWLFDQTAGKHTYLTPGSDFSIAGVTGKVVSIAADGAVLEIDGEQWRLELGKSLRQLQKLPKVEAAKANSPPA